MMKQNIILTKKGKSANGTIQLTGSKSECNRALVIEALSSGKVKVQNVSDAADAVLLADILRNDTGLKSRDAKLVNIGPAGTAMRFLTAYFTLQQGDVFLSGSERMKQRPIGILVDALRDLGADIRYVE